MAAALTKDTTVVATRELLSCDLAGEAVLLDPKAGIYYGLNTVGNSVWKLIQQPITVADIRDAILREYAVDADRCERDILALLQQAADAGLIEVRNVHAG